MCFLGGHTLCSVSVCVFGKALGAELPVQFSVRVKLGVSVRICKK
jgi:hypothetical protein